MARIRVLVTDDSVVVRRLVSECLGSDPDIEVAGIAADGKIALARIEQLSPDLVTLDIEMPVLDGLKTLVEIRKTHPRLPVIMFSTMTERGATATLDALTLGANDYVTKPSNLGSVGLSIEHVREELIPKIKALCGRGPSKPCVPLSRPMPSRHQVSGVVDVLVIGASTGGPNALATLLPKLGKDFPIPIVIVQHMPPLFTRLLAERLAHAAAMPTCEAAGGTILHPGAVWIAPGGLHLEVERGTTGVHLKTHEGPLENSCRPSVDVLFRSVAKAYGARSLAVILTGMGHDGLGGCRHIREAGGQVLAQDEASSVVWGMPGAVTSAGLAERTLPLPELAMEISRRANPVVRGSSLTRQVCFAKAS